MLIPLLQWNAKKKLLVDIRKKIDKEISKNGNREGNKNFWWEKLRISELNRSKTDKRKKKMEINNKWERGEKSKRTSKKEQKKQQQQNRRDGKEKVKNQKMKRWKKEDKGSREEKKVSVVCNIMTSTQNCFNRIFPIVLRKRTLS